MYKTGDFGKFLPDGNIEYLGRIDNQVKINGYRIECEEIEKALLEHPHLKEVVVVTKANSNQEKYLCAYYISNQNIRTKEFRKYLTKKFLDYMIPSFFIKLTKFPVMSNNKIDRQKLKNKKDKYMKSINYIAPQTILEKKLCKIWEQILIIKPIGITDNFFELGGDSLKVINLLNEINNQLNLELKINKFLNKPTIKNILTPKNKKRPIHTEPDHTPILDCQAPKNLNHIKSIITKPKNILLTGATGFLGAFVLKELLEQHNASIYCLVRAENKNHGYSRVKQNLKKYKIWNSNFNNKIIPIIGDLVEPLLDLGQKEFNNLAKKIDLIYHCGAFVNFVYPYQILEQTNVLGTKEIIKFAKRSKIKPINYTSTLSVFETDTTNKILDENKKVQTDLLKNGYAQSKLEAEKIIQAAREKGLPTIIYRPTTISGDLNTGLVNNNDFIKKLIKGIMQLQYAPNLNIPINIVPVDYVSKTIVSISKESDLYDKNFHLHNPQKLTLKLIVTHLNTLGYKIKITPYEKWIKKLKTNIERNELKPFLPLLLEKKASGLSMLETMALEKYKISDINTIQFLKNTNIKCPEIDQTIISTYYC